MARADDPAEVLRRISALTAKVESRLDSMGPEASTRDFTALVRAVREVYELGAKLSGLLESRLTIQIVESPIFKRFLERVGESVVTCPKCAKAYEGALDEAIKVGTKP